MVFRRKDKPPKGQQPSYRDRPKGYVIDNEYDYDPNDVRTGSCFIATAVYGTPMAREIQILRDYRDKFLLQRSLGKIIVNHYYRWSPPFARYLAAHKSVAGIIRRLFLIPIVRIASMVLE
jgi:hypothetical protein